ncbi:hypothetical protein [Endozoicomonas lisbonensis]|uniref:Uncharacterized protein n=1 Tax=Endozoicomonas lisbonensis TaxID=3120522 RepID=A0ABV2SD31_9GAMM
MSVFNEKHRQFAAKKLELPDNWELVYQSVDVPFIYDSCDVSDFLKTEHEDNDYQFGLMDVEVAVDEATIHIPLPAGLRIVGMKSPETGERFYGVVDFNPIEQVELAE